MPRVFRAAMLLSAAAALALPGCAAFRSSNVPAVRAFALSASALSGSDNYTYSGEVSIFDPRGALSGKTRYEGQVKGHDGLKLKWSVDTGAVHASAAASPAVFHPLQLLDAIEKRTASVTYAHPSAEAGTVRLRIAMSDSAARARIADGLRAQLSGLRAEWKSRRMSLEQRRKAEAVLADAERKLDSAVSSLRVKTACWWTADQKTWFPRQMKEETELTYVWNGKKYREKRVSVTNFLPAGQSGTMGK